jgi:hypothetical protein
MQKFHEEEKTVTTKKGTRGEKPFDETTERTSKASVQWLKVVLQSIRLLGQLEDRDPLPAEEPDARKRQSIMYHELSEMRDAAEREGKVTPSVDPWGPIKRVIDAVVGEPNDGKRPDAAMREISRNILPECEREEAGGRGQRSEVRGQEAGDGGQEPGARGQEPGVVEANFCEQAGVQSAIRNPHSAIHDPAVSSTSDDGNAETQLSPPQEPSIQNPKSKFQSRPTSSWPTQRPSPRRRQCGSYDDAQSHRPKTEAELVAEHVATLRLQYEINAYRLKRYYQELAEPDVISRT